MDSGKMLPQSRTWVRMLLLDSTVERTCAIKMPCPQSRFQRPILSKAIDRQVWPEALPGCTPGFPRVSGKSVKRWSIKKRGYQYLRGCGPLLTSGPHPPSTLLPGRSEQWFGGRTGSESLSPCYPFGTIASNNKPRNIYTGQATLLAKGPSSLCISARRTPCSA